MEPEQVYFKNSRNLKLFGELTIPEDHKPSIIILCHGHKNRRNGRIIQQISKFICDSKYIIFTFDLTGHGESEGSIEETTLTHAIDDVSCAIALMRKQFPLYKIGLLGSSFGGAACVFAANREISAVVLSSPVIDYYSKRKRIAKEYNISFSQWKKEGAVGEDKSKQYYPYYEDAAQYDFYKKAEQLKIPLLVIAGDQDKEVLIAETKKFYKNLAGAKHLDIVRNMGHHRSNEELEYIAKRAREWFDKYLTDAS